MCFAAGAVLERPRRVFVFVQNILHQLRESLRTRRMGSMEGTKATLCHSQRGSSAINAPPEGDEFVACAADMNIETAAI